MYSIYYYLRSNTKEMLTPTPSCFWCLLFIKSICIAIVATSLAFMGSLYLYSFKMNAPRRTHSNHFVWQNWKKMTTHHFRIVYKRGERVTCSQLKMELRWKPPSVSFFRILVFHWVFQWRYFPPYYKLFAGIVKVSINSSDIKANRHWTIKY